MSGGKVSYSRPHGTGAVPGLKHIGDCHQSCGREDEGLPGPCTHTLHCFPASLNTVFFLQKRLFIFDETKVPFKYPFF